MQRVTCHESGVWAAHIAGVALDTLSVNANNNSNSCKRLRLDKVYFCKWMGGAYRVRTSVLLVR